ncbi:ABC transporter ATP-binding protein [Glycomyces buryatensis]|uniref:ABC transporter ATP-binding protein n=1 Tax=Glycomyces buryatensis TaxID=2570927 RepID=A0A4S8Q0Q4_9ACTN|nr:ABC transporter ATP-binding protein [Glycomyces buryatensis]THV33654.1 ABC transporter ATP-binding protein [Glycomyces buryatensis]
MSPKHTYGSAALLRPLIRLLGVLRGHRAMFWQSTASLALSLLTAAAAAGLSAYAASLVVQDPSDTGLAQLLLLGLACAVIAHGAFTWIESWLSHVMAYRVIDGLRLGLHDGIERLTPGGLGKRRGGEVAGAAMADAETLEWFYAHTVGASLCAAVSPLVVVGALIALTGPIGLIAFAGVAALIAVPWFLGPLQARQGKAVRDGLGDLKAITLEGAEGLREMLSLGLAERQKRRVLEATERVQRRKRALALRAGAESALADLIVAATFIAFLVALTAAVSGGRLDPALFPAAMVLLTAAFIPASAIFPMFQRLGEMSAAATRVLDVIDAPAQVADTGTDSAGARQRGDGAVRFEHVDFAYEAGTPVLDGLDFTVPAGEHVAVVGASGAGKTTLAHLLMRFWDPVSGRVLLDGTDLRERPIAAVRERIALIPQHPYVFRGTVRSNLDLAVPGADEAAMWKALESAQLADTVREWPAGLDEAVGENGATLSGGQRQRLAIAQAFLREADVLVMDEAAAHLDGIGEQALARAVAEVMDGRTTLVIAHRVSTIRHADRVLFLDGGRLADTGTHTELLERNPAYRALLAQAELPADEPAEG